MPVCKDLLKSFVNVEQIISAESLISLAFILSDLGFRFTKF